MADSGLGAIIAMAPCYLCGQMFAFDPETVSAILIDGRTGLPPDLCRCGDGPACQARANWQPMCPPCVAQANRERARAGRSLIPEAPHAEH